VTPNFDPEVPFLMATVIPIYNNNVSSYGNNVSPEVSSSSGGGDGMLVNVGLSQSDLDKQRLEHVEGLDAIRREGISMIHSYQQQFSQQVEAVINNMMERVNNLHQRRDGL